MMIYSFPLPWILAKLKQHGVGALGGGTETGTGGVVQPGPTAGEFEHCALDALVDIHLDSLVCG